MPVFWARKMSTTAVYTVSTWCYLLVEFRCQLLVWYELLVLPVSASFTRCWLFTVYDCLLAGSEWSLLLVLVKIQVRVGMGVHEYMGECVTHITGMWWVTFASGLLQMVSTKNLILIEYTELMHFFFKLWCQTSVRPLRLGMHMHFGGFSFIHYYIFYSFHLWYKLWFTWDDPVNEETPNST